MLKLLNLTKKKIHEDHIFQNIKNKGTIIETYVRLKIIKVYFLLIVAKELMKQT